MIMMAMMMMMVMIMKIDHDIPIHFAKIAVFACFRLPFCLISPSALMFFLMMK